MSTLIEKLEQGFARVTQLLKQTATDLNGKIGALTGLNTTSKSSLVTAINEVNTKTDGKAVINDSSQSATTTYSSNKIAADINTAVVTVIGGADGHNDTLKELADRVTAVAQADNGLVSAVAAQSFNTAQQLQARSNIGAVATSDVGDILNADFVAIINAAYTA